MTSFYSRKYFQEMVEQGEYVQFYTLVDGIEIYYHPTQFRFHVFVGRKKKPQSYITSSKELMLCRIDSFIESQYKKMVDKQKKKAADKIQAEEARKNIQVGDIFSTSWGYDRTIVDFFEVTERVSNAYVNIKQIDSVMVEGNHYSGRVMPVPGSYVSEAKKCQINKWGHLVKADDYGHTAYKTSADDSHHVSCD